MGSLVTSPLLRSRAKLGDRVSLDLVDDLKSEVQIFGLSWRLRSGPMVGKPLPDFLKKSSSKSSVILEDHAGRPKKLDKQGLKNGGACEGFIQDVVVGHVGHSDASPADLYQAYQHHSKRLVQGKTTEKRADPNLTAILVERLTIYNRALAYVLSASVVFAIAFYAATKV